MIIQIQYEDRAHTASHTQWKMGVVRSVQERGGLIPSFTHQEPSEHLLCTAAPFGPAVVSVLVEFMVFWGRGDQTHIHINEQETYRL